LMAMRAYVVNLIQISRVVVMKLYRSFVEITREVK
jgi:hypothetical protein